jgi:transposase-like protein
MQSIELGLTYQQAAQVAGIDETTLHRWKRQGEKAKSGKFRQFYQAIKKANVKARLVLLERIGKTGEGGEIVKTTSEIHDAKGNLVRRVITKKEMPPVWQASAWILERRFPDEFGRKAKPQLSDEQDPLQEWLDALVEAEAEAEK